MAVPTLYYFADRRGEAEAVRMMFKEARVVRFSFIDCHLASNEKKRCCVGRDELRYVLKGLVRAERRAWENRFTPFGNALFSHRLIGYF